MSNSGRNNSKISNRASGGGNKKQGLAPQSTSFFKAAFTGQQYETNTYAGKGRFKLICMNQLGGVGNRYNSQFAPTADGTHCTKDACVNEFWGQYILTPSGESAPPPIPVYIYSRTVECWLSENNFTIMAPPHSCGLCDPLFNKWSYGNDFYDIYCPANQSGCAAHYDDTDNYALARTASDATAFKNLVGTSYTTVQAWQNVLKNSNITDLWIMSNTPADEPFDYPNNKVVIFKKSTNNVITDYNSLPSIQSYAGLSQS